MGTASYTFLISTQQWDDLIWWITLYLFHSLNSKLPAPLHGHSITHFLSLALFSRGTIQFVGLRFSCFALWAARKASCRHSITQSFVTQLQILVAELSAKKRSVLLPLSSMPSCLHPYTDTDSHTDRYRQSTDTDTDTNTGTYTGTDTGTASHSLFRNMTEGSCLTVLTKPFLLPNPACFFEWHHVLGTHNCKQGR